MEEDNDARMPLRPAAVHITLRASEKAGLVWSAQALSVTKALVFGLAPEIPTTNNGRPLGA
jgi:hypothetical protein